MEAVSPLYAALGIVEFEALNDLAFWLDGRTEPKRPADSSSGDRAAMAARSAGREG